jgi:hypothetical protein
MRECSFVPDGSRVIVENILGDAPFEGELPDLDPENGDVFLDRRTDRVMDGLRCRIASQYFDTRHRY